MKSSPHRFFYLVRAHNRTKKPRDKWLEGYNLRKNERAFRKNAWHFAESSCKGSEQASSGSLSCSSEEALPSFSCTFKVMTFADYEGLPLWVNEVIPFPSDEVYGRTFDMSPITPGVGKFFSQEKVFELCSWR